MNKSELAQAVADRAGVQKAQAEAVIEAMVDVITETIASGGSVTLAGFGEFSARVRKGRVGVNPQDTSKAIDIPPVPVPKFKSGSRLKKTVKEGALAGNRPGATAPAHPAPAAASAPTAPVHPAHPVEPPPEPQPPTPPPASPAPEPQPPTPPPAPPTPAPSF